jgi:hypothetical protein
MGAVLPEVLEAVADEAGDQQPRSAGDCGGTYENEGERHAALDGDDLHASVGHRESDIDRGDGHQAERVDGRAVEPPEDERRGGLDDADGDAPDDRRTV